MNAQPLNDAHDYNTKPTAWKRIVVSVLGAKERILQTHRLLMPCPLPVPLPVVGGPTLARPANDKPPLALQLLVERKQPILQFHSGRELPTQTGDRGTGGVVLFANLVILGDNAFLFLVHEVFDVRNRRQDDHVGHSVTIACDGRDGSREAAVMISAI